MDETAGAKIVHALVFLAICASIIYVGWGEPLRYRFLSVEDIATEAREAAPVVEPPPEWKPQGTALDRAPYRIRRGEVSYSRNVDPRRVGTATEAERRQIPKR